jgi:hypothetical protein
LVLLAPSAQAISETLVINEVDYDQPGTDTTEYLEVKNVSAAPIDLDPYSIRLVNGANNTVYATIDLPASSLAVGDYFVVCANAATVANCDLDASPDTNLIQNGNPDAVAIVLAEAIVDTVSYGGVTTGYTEGSSGAVAENAGQGLSRCEDGVDTDLNDADFEVAALTPGTTNTCPEPPPPFGACADPATLIHDIQGAGATSPLAGSILEIEGVVVGDFQNNAEPDTGNLNGFYLQEEDTQVDDDPATSEGLFVFAAGAADVQVGDLVRVKGTVTEFATSGGSSMTELASVTDLADCGTAALPTPSTVTFPLTAVSDLERFEGMSTLFPQDLVISEYFNYDRFGEVVISLPFEGEDRLSQPTAVVEPGAPSIALQGEIVLRRITLDDGLGTQNPSFTRHPNGAEFTLGNRFRGGDTLTDTVGVIDQSFGLYRIQPTAGADYDETNPRPASPAGVGGELTVSSFNVLNYFLTLDDGVNDICGPAQNQECRGADDAAEFDRQRAKILAALAEIDADVFGLIEMENTTGVEPLADIVAGLNAMGEGPYSFVDTGTIGTDAIRVGIIYKTTSVTPLGDYAILDSSVDPAFIDTLNRPVLAQSFVDSDGGVFTVAVNHLKSKGSDCNAVGDPDLGDGQGNCNQTRLAAARAQIDWLAADPTGSGDPDVLIIGDLNSYDMEDPIDAVVEGPDDTVGTDDDYADLIRQFQGDLAYSYVFDGLIGYLDHGLANSTLAPQVSGATVWHINADEPDLLDYDTTFKSPEQDALFAEDAYRSSDHDPVILGLDVNAPPACDVANAKPNRLWVPNHRFVPIAIKGITDPEGDRFEIVVDSIFQDEALKAPGSGNTEPDGRGVGSSRPQVRAERVAFGNGRFYHISFTATDENGATCSGEVTVAVPRVPWHDPVDDGPRFDSTIKGGFELTILHNNDGESQLIDAGTDLEDFGGVARFATVVRNTKFESRIGGLGSIFVSSGDNFLAGPEFTAGLENGVFYDAVALDKLDYDAIALGNHDFDFGPDVLADFIETFRRPGRPPYLSSNLDFTAEPALQELYENGVIAESTVVREDGERIGIIGAITPSLNLISSPRNVFVDPDVAGAVQEEVDALQARGIDKIVLISHLQDIDEEIALAKDLSGVDVMVAGGGDELLANPDDLLVPGDTVAGPYPLLAVDADGVTIPVVTTPGSYKYLGELTVQFDSDGNVVAYSGGPIRVAGGDNPDAVRADRQMQRQVVDPVEEFVEGLAANVIAQSAVALEGRRAPGVRTQETNLGNLVADSQVWQAGQLAAEFGVPAPQVGLQNGGGIRNETLIPAGPISELETFNIVPFSNFVAVVPDVPRDQFRQILERAVSGIPDAAGQFAQISGFSFTYDPAQTAQVIATDGSIVTPGARVRSLILDDGTVIVENGVVLAGDPIDVATIDFLARGGDGYPFLGLPFTTVGVSYQQALANFIQGPLAGQITAADYPEGGEGRITQLP